MYIVFEGIVGTGKTTQARRLAGYLQRYNPTRQVVYTREPGGTEIAESIRKLVQGTQFNEHMDPVCEAYLYASARAQSLGMIVAPCLKDGGIVIADRSFVTSLAYQGYVRGLGIGKVWKINHTAIDEMLPDVILFLDLSVQTALNRTSDTAGDKFETLGADFFIKAREGFLLASQLSPLIERWQTVDAEGTQDEVFERILAVVLSKIEKGE